MAEIVYLNDFTDLKEIEIYTILPVKDLESKLKESESPVEFFGEDNEDKDDSDFANLSCFKLKQTERPYGCIVDSYYSADSDVPDIPQSLIKILGDQPESFIFTDENVSDASTFVPYYKPVIDYLKSQKIGFVMVGRDEEMKSEIMGWHIDGKTFINGSFRYPHKRLLEE